MGPNQTEKFLHSKGNPKQHKKATHRMGENLCKSNNSQGIHLQNLETPSAAQCQKNKQPHQKMSRRSKQTILQRRHMDGQKTHEKMFNITHYQRNANQNHYEVPPDTSQNGHLPKVYKQ